MAAKDERVHLLNRAATISNATPLRYKDKQISTAKREKFQALELETLLSEFRAVAAQKVGEDDDEEEDAAQAQSAVGVNEKEWLDHVGLSALTDKIAQGMVITEEDIKTLTVGLTAAQIKAIKDRCLTLNGTLRSAAKAARGDARDLFGIRTSSDVAAMLPAAGPAAPSSAAPLSDGVPEPLDLDAEALEKLSMLTEAEDIVVRFDDLSQEDQEQAQCLMLIQLTSLLEQKNQSHTIKSGKKKKIKKKKKVEGAFEIDMETLVERDRQLFGDKLKNPNVPLVFQRIIESLLQHGLQEEGIFRKAGSSARIKAFRGKCDEMNGDVTFDSLGALAHDVSALLKQFLRDLPEPLLTSEYIEAFACTQQFEDPALQLYAIQLLVMLLSPVHRACIKTLLDFLALVAAHSDVNKMGITNLAVVFAPTLFYIRGQKGEKMLKEVEIQISTATTLKLMIEFSERLWEVPTDIMGQLRFLNEGNRNRKHRGRGAKKFFSSKTRGSSKLLDDDVPRIQWVDISTETPPVRALVTVAVASKPSLDMIKITDDTLAEHVLQLAGVDLGRFFLVERGGNIVLRRLDPSAKVIMVLRRNPYGTLLVTDSMIPT